jgi:hypothetical protein
MQECYADPISLPNLTTLLASSSHDAVLANLLPLALSHVEACHTEACRATRTGIPNALLCSVLSTVLFTLIPKSLTKSLTGTPALTASPPAPLAPPALLPSLLSMLKSLPYIPPLPSIYASLLTRLTSPSTNTATTNHDLITNIACYVTSSPTDIALSDWVAESDVAAYVESLPEHAARGIITTLLTTKHIALNDEMMMKMHVELCKATKGGYDYWTLLHDCLGADVNKWSIFGELLVECDDMPAILEPCVKIMNATPKSFILKLLNHPSYNNLIEAWNRLHNDVDVTCSIGNDTVIGLYVDCKMSGIYNGIVKYHSNPTKYVPVFINQLEDTVDSCISNGITSAFLECIQAVLDVDSGSLIECIDGNDTDESSLWNKIIDYITKTPKISAAALNDKKDKDDGKLAGRRKLGVVVEVACIRDYVGSGVPRWLFCFVDDSEPRNAATTATTATTATAATTDVTTATTTATYATTKPAVLGKYLSLLATIELSIKQLNTLLHHSSNFTGSIPPTVLHDMYSKHLSENVLRKIVTDTRKSLGDSSIEKKMLDSFIHDVRECRGLFFNVLVHNTGSTTNTTDGDHGHSMLGKALCNDIYLAVDSNSGGIDSKLFEQWLECIQCVFSDVADVVAVADVAGDSCGLLIGIMRKYGIPLNAVNKLVNTVITISSRCDTFYGTTIINDCVNSLEAWLENGGGDWFMEEDGESIKFANPMVLASLVKAVCGSVEGLWTNVKDSAKDSAKATSDTPDTSDNIITNSMTESLDCIMKLLAPLNDKTLCCELLDKGCKTKLFSAVDKIMINVRYHVTNFDIPRASAPEWIGKLSEIIKGIKRWNSVEKRRWSNTNDDTSGEDIRKRLGTTVGKCESIEGVAERRLKGLVTEKVKREKGGAKKTRKTAKKDDGGGKENGEVEAATAERIITALSSFVKTSKSFEFADAVAISGPFKKRAAGEAAGGRGKKKIRKGIVRSRNAIVDDWLEEEGVEVGDDAFDDLEGFIC